MAPSFDPDFEDGSWDISKQILENTIKIIENTTWLFIHKLITLMLIILNLRGSTYQLNIYLSITFFSSYKLILNALIIMEALNMLIFILERNSLIFFKEKENFEIYFCCKLVVSLITTLNCLFIYFLCGLFLQFSTTFR